MIVLDASVIAKWFIEEEKTSSSLYYRDLQAEKKEIIMPYLQLDFLKIWRNINNRYCKSSRRME
ncbi:MAG: hypothetical protein COT33_01490 [Candidatus Nealsonbacteria bacterium CG08_land_8_20_14_0_20_38_20]|uniref:PIN domain-containing protein n=1 Tax=Candidatus Nealsonbacteria bacterium CG08_land_8_20_14_0_20_38_20 TaxID=1974705 RepID=A0A2H0YM01_9BACT|nr:MAG: hypothetical protein COT33_01490 [Candidatus Nealsonbacteria bacterium CG08_land_8_20_14_0_20_38_20]